MNRYILYLGIIATTLFGGCEKLAYDDKVSTDARENFEYLWNQCDQNYAFFDYKNIDWLAVKNTYSAQIYDGMPETELFDVLANMMNELQDGHVNLKSEFNISIYTGFYDASEENYNKRVIQENYTGFETIRTGPFEHARLLNNNDIAYVRLASFATVITDYEIDFIVDLYKNSTKGLILDIRNNGGGQATNVEQLGSRFTNTEIHTLDLKYKNGPGHNDFTDPEKITISPDGSFYDKPVMLLTSRQSYSASSFFSASMHAFPNVVQVGDSTGGGMGAPNGGELPNGWMYRVSVTSNSTPNGDLWEYGVPADIYVDDDPATLTVDEIIDRAVQEIQTLNP